MSAAGSPVDRGYLTTLDVWAVEPYFGGSHRHFLEGLAARSQHQVESLTLPGRHWKWRMHGGALSLAEEARARLAGAAPGVGIPPRTAAAQSRPAPDVFFASSMLDLPAFMAVAGPPLANVPVALYFHENQLTYPLPPDTPRDLGYGMKNIASALAAQTVLFNSRFHKEEFLGAVEDLLDSMPDEVPSWVPQALRRRSRVLPVGCDLAGLDDGWQQAQRDKAAGRWGDAAAGPLILWNQRWEYDKDPATLFAALRALKDKGVPYRLAVAGAGHGTPPPEFAQAREDLGDRVVQWGRVEDRLEYASLLWASDVVVSTAIHEFFGIAVVEAVYCGCRPVLPWRLSYPEIIPQQAHEEVLYREGALVSALERASAHPGAWSEDWQRTWVARYDWAIMAPRYDEEIRRCWNAAWEER